MTCLEERLRCSSGPGVLVFRDYREFEKILCIETKSGQPLLLFSCSFFSNAAVFQESRVS